MINKIILGTVQFGLNYGITNKNGKIDDKEIEKIFDFCNNYSILYFDTAQDYGKSEDILSKFNKLYPNLKIITKAKFANKNIDITIDKSLKKFKRIECFMLHSFNDFKNKKLINKLIQLKKEKKIQKIGVSIYNVNEAIILLNDINIDIIQIPFNYLDKQWFNIKFQNLVKQNKKEIHVRSIFLQGILLKKPIKYPNNISKSEFEDLENKINIITNKFNMSKLELCFFFVNSFDWINHIIIGIDNFNQLLMNFEIFKKNLKINKKEIDFIRDKFSNINPFILDPSEWRFN
jgi:uncharacterized protein